MKLSVISDESRAEEIVPKISEYANSQNKVNHIDFSSNNKFHVDMENFSRKILALKKQELRYKLDGFMREQEDNTIKKKHC